MLNEQVADLFAPAKTALRIDEALAQFLVGLFAKLFGELMNLRGLAAQIRRRAAAPGAADQRVDGSIEAAVQLARRDERGAPVVGGRLHFRSRKSATDEHG